MSIFGSKLSTYFLFPLPWKTKPLAVVSKSLWDLPSSIPPSHLPPHSVPATGLVPLTHWELLWLWGFTSAVPSAGNTLCPDSHVTNCLTSPGLCWNVPLFKSCHESSDTLIPPARKLRGYKDIWQHGQKGSLWSCAKPLTKWLPWMRGSQPLRINEQCPTTPAYASDVLPSNTSLYHLK